MNILIVPSWYKTRSNPTLGSFFYEQACMLKEMGNNVIIADVSFQSRRDYFSGKCYKLIKKNDNGIIEYSYVVPSFGRFNKSNGGTDITYRNLKKIYHRILGDGFKIDIIHAHSYLPAGVAAVRIAKEEGIPIVVTEHSSDLLLENINPTRKCLLAEVVDSSDRFLCVSNKLRDKIVDLTNCDETKLVVLPNVVDSMFECKKKDFCDEFTFISIGNLIQGKRFDLTIDSFAKAFSKDEKVKLKIVGDGPLKKKLERRVKSLGEETRISFLGRLGRSEVVKHLQESSCFVLPSDFETFGVVYIEALAVGNPVIGTRNGGADDIVTKDNGILVDKDNVSQLSMAMRDMYCGKNLYSKEQISSMAINRYGRTAVGNALQRVYLELIEKKQENS